jgi:hypothetical protein
MLVVMKVDATEGQIADVVSVIDNLGLRPHRMRLALLSESLAMKVRLIPPTLRICQGSPKPFALPSLTN